MTSNSSIYKMIREHFRHNMWMLGLSAIGSFLFGPIVFLFSHGGTNFERYRLNHTYEEYADYVSSQVIIDLNYSSAALTVIAAIGAAIVAFGIFSYLFNSRKIDLYHALPVTRKELFWSGYLTGLYIWLIPFLAGTILSFACAFVFLENTATIGGVLFAMVEWLLYPTFGFFIIYHLCLVAIMLSGNMANAMVSTGVWGLSVFTLHAILAMYAEAFFDTYYNPGDNGYLSCGFSPLATPFGLISYQNYNWDYALIAIPGILIALLNLYVAYRLHAVRKSELAGHGMDSKIGSLTIRVCITLIVGLMGVIPMWLFGYNLKTRPIWLLLFTALFSLIAFTITTAIQKRSVRAFFAHKVQMIAITICTMLIVSTYCFDFFSYDTRIPAKGSVESMNIEVHGFDQYYYYGRDFEGYEITDATIIHGILQTAVSSDKYGNTFPITVKVSPKFGFDYYRRYQLHTKDIDALRPVVETPEYMTYRLQTLLKNQDIVDSIDVYAAHTSHLIVDHAHVKEIMEAYIKDSYQLLDFEEQGEYLIIAELCFSDSYSEDGTRDNGYYNIAEFPVSPAHVNTIAALSKANEDILITKEQFEVRSVTVSKYNYGTLSLLDSLYKDLLTPDMLNIDKEYAEEYGVEVSDNLKEEAVIIQSAPTVEVYGGNDYSYIFMDEELEWLMPYLYFAHNYQDSFGFDNYSYIGRAVIQHSSEIDAYIKRGSMTPEEIQKLAKYLESNPLKY